MQKFRAKQDVLVVMFEAKTINNSSKSHENVLNLIFTCNFKFNTTAGQSVSTLKIVTL